MTASTILVDEAPDPAGGRLRVATWNVWWRFGSWQARAEAIGAVLNEIDADVVALQEIWSDCAGTLAHVLGERLGLHAASAPAAVPRRWRGRIAEDGDVGVGTAILSRWPVRAEPLALPGDEMGGVFALLAHPAGPLPVFCVHLHADPAGSAVRGRQVRWLAEEVARRRSPSRPTLVMGDFNAEPDSDEMRLLCGAKTAPAVEGQVLLDAWLFAPPGAPGTTWDRGNPHVAATPFPSARIDYILLDAVGSGTRVVSVRRLGDAPIDDVWPSDHFGVLAELELGP